MQPDTITPGGPQGLNRYSYVRNNPVNFNDPTGHRPCGDGEIFDCDGRKQDPNVDPNTGGGGDADDYIGSIPDAIIEQLVAQGADPNFLATVTIHNKQDDEWKKWCRPGKAAVTWYNTIYFCNTDLKYYDPNKPTATLLHELIHVSQFQRDPILVLEELRRTGDMKERDRYVKQWNDSWLGQHLRIIDWLSYDPYKWSWVEVQGDKCQDAFKVNPSMPLDIPPCNLAPFK